MHISQDFQIFLKPHLKATTQKKPSIAFREAARTSIGSNMPAKSLELKHTIKLIRELDSEIEEIENEIKVIMDESILQSLAFLESAIEWVP